MSNEKFFLSDYTKGIEVRMPNRFMLIRNVWHDREQRKRSWAERKRDKLVDLLIRRTRRKRIAIRITLQILASLVILSLAVVAVIFIVLWLRSLGIRHIPMIGFPLGMFTFLITIITWDKISDAFDTGYRMEVRHHGKIYNSYL